MLRAIEQTLSNLRDLRTDSAFDTLLKVMKLLRNLTWTTWNCHGLVVLVFTCPSNRTCCFVRCNNNIRSFSANILPCTRCSDSGTQERFTDNAHGDLKIYRAMEDWLLSGVFEAGVQELLCPYNEIDWSNFVL